MKHYAFLKKAALFAALTVTTASSLSAISYSKDGCVSRSTTLTITNPQTQSVEKTTFNSKQVFCHTAGFRQTPVAVIFYGQSAVFPPVNTKTFIEFSPTEKIQLLNGVDVTTLASARSLQSFITEVKNKFGYSPTAQTLVKFPNPSETFFLEVEKESDYNSPGSSVLCCTIYGEAATIPPHVLKLLKELIAPNEISDASFAFPITTFKETREFALQVLDYVTCTNLPQNFDYWLRPQSQNTWSQPTPMSYPKDVPFVIENALFEKLDVVLKSCVSTNNCYNQDGKQCRMIFAWESDIIALGNRLNNYAKQLNENHWNLIVLNDLQREYTSQEKNKVLDVILDKNNTLIIPKTVMIYTPVSSPTSTATTTRASSFVEVAPDLTLVLTTNTYSKELPMNEAILRLVGQLVGENTKNQPAFPYK